MLHSFLAFRSGEVILSEIRPQLQLFTVCFFQTMLRVERPIILEISPIQPELCVPGSHLPDSISMHASCQHTGSDSYGC
eukprot:m.188904 g.188904  ORF g.188904 m.188904 type:complete len:79 (-) comp16938_c1_seq18:2963-3199(-)